jgi:dienelactone hydrolase
VEPVTTQPRGERAVLRRTGRQLSIRRPRHAQVAGVVLVLHGGQVDNTEPTTARQPAVLLMRAFAWALHRRLSRHGMVVARLRFTLRGWNGAQASPVPDARWAVAALQAEFAVPVVLVGHSMGGRTAVRVADAPGVIGVVGLAPWLPDGEPVQQLAGRGLAVLHGDRDRVTDPALSRAFVQRAAPIANRASFETIAGSGHNLVTGWRHWHRLTAVRVRELCADAVAGACDDGTAS